VTQYDGTIDQLGDKPTQLADLLEVVWFERCEFCGKEHHYRELNWINDQNGWICDPCITSISLALSPD